MYYQSLMEPSRAVFSTLHCSAWCFQSCFCNDVKTSIKIGFKTDDRLFKVQRPRPRWKRTQYAISCSQMTAHSTPPQRSRDTRVWTLFHYLQLWPHNQCLGDGGHVQPAPQKPYVKALSKRELWKLLYKFSYIGCRLSRSVSIDDEKKLSIQAATWRKEKHSAAPSWRCNKHLYCIRDYTPARLVRFTTAKSKSFHKNWLKRLMRFTWQVKVRVEGVLVRADLPSIYPLLRKA